MRTAWCSAGNISATGVDADRRPGRRCHRESQAVALIKAGEQGLKHHHTPCGLQSSISKHPQMSGAQLFNPFFAGWYAGQAEAEVESRLVGRDSDPQFRLA